MSKRTYPQVSIIIVNYNGRKHLKDCLTSVDALRYPSGKLETIVVDNGSSDGSLEMVKASFPGVKVLKNSINNYCAANNLAVKESKAQFIALLNNDAKPEREWLEELIEVLLSEKRWAGACGKVLFPDGTLQDTGHWQLPNFYWTMRGLRDNELSDIDEMQEVESISNCAAVYRRDRWEKAGGLDEDFAMYYEDVDFCLRCRAQGGKFVYVPSAVVRHELGGSGDEDQRLALQERSRLLFVAKHFPEKLGEALQGLGFYTVTQDPRGERDIIQVLPEVVKKLIREHPPEKVESVLRDVLAGIRKVYRYERVYMIDRLSEEGKRVKQLERRADRLRVEMEVRAARIKGLEDTRKHLEGEVGRLEESLEDTGKRVQELEHRNRQLDALLSRSEYMLQRASAKLRFLSGQTSVKSILVVKPYGLPMREMDIALQRFRVIYPEAQISLLANLDEDDYLTLSVSSRFAGKLLYCPTKNPLTRKALIKLCLRLRFSRWDLGVALQTETGYAGDKRARELARLAGRRWCTFPRREKSKESKTGLLSLGKKRMPRRKKARRSSECLSLGFASFLAAEKEVRRGDDNAYIIRISNPAEGSRRARLVIDIYACSNPVHPEGHYASMSKTVVVLMGQVLQVLVDYDWEEKARFTVDGRTSPPDHFQRGPVNTRQLYRLEAVLYGEGEQILDQIAIFQEL